MNNTNVMPVAVILTIVLSVPLLVQAHQAQAPPPAPSPEGSLEARATALEAAVATLQSALAAARSAISTLQSDLGTANSNIASLQSGLAAANSNISTLVDLAPFVSVVPTSMDGLTGPHVIFEGANVHIRSGSGSTDDGGTFTGLGKPRGQTIL